MLKRLIKCQLVFRGLQSISHQIKAVEQPVAAMNFQFFIVDAFIDPEKPFSGNPAAVVLLDNDSDISGSIKHDIAAQFNLSETAFVSKLPQSSAHDGQFLIRWMTPTNEVPLCGHATLAATHVLVNEKTNRFYDVVKSCERVKFTTKFGSKLECSVEKEQSRLVLNFPVNKPVPIDVVSTGQNQWFGKLYSSLLAGTDNVKLLDVQWSASSKKLLLRLDSDKGKTQILTTLKPNFAELGQINSGDMVRGVIVTQKADIQADKVHFWSRYFTPWNGIDEDPVTGSAHTVLAPYWRENEPEYQQVSGVLLARQLSKRSGLMATQVSPDGRALLGGSARSFAQGTFIV